MAWAALILSIACLGGTSIAIAGALARPGPDRFWVAIAAAAMQVGTIATISSALRRFEPTTVLLLQTGLSAAVAALVRLRRRPPEAPLTLGPVIGGDWVCAALAAATVLLLAVAGLQQAVTPISGQDEGMYHAPRMAYWLQHRSIFPYRTPNDRQIAFPFGCELVAAWPLLFVKAEWLARMVFWLEFPGATAGVWIVARVIGASRRAALAGSLLFAATPAVFFAFSRSFSCDVWGTLFALGAAYGVVRRRTAGELPGRRFFLAGIFLALAVNVKTTSLALAPGLALGALLEHDPRRIARCLLGAFGGFVLAAATSGLAVVLVGNGVREGHPLGPADIRAIVRADPSPLQVWVHTVRTPFTLMQLAEVPSDGLRVWLEAQGSRLADCVGASTRLPMEDPTTFPGAFVFRVPRTGDLYTTGGLLWLPVLAVGIAGALSEFRRSWRRPTLSPASTLAVLQLPLFLGVVYLIRWMNGGPDRFWLGAYALSVPLSAKVIGDLAARRWGVTAAAACLLPATVYPVARTAISEIDGAIMSPLPLDAIDAPFQEPIPKLPDESRILLFALGGTREYWLFNPWGGFTRQVFPWGRTAFNPRRADALVSDQRITHVLIEHDAAYGIGWNAASPSPPVIAWIEQRPDFKAVPLSTPHMRLYERCGP
jgi:hypothetical protein